MRGGQAARGTVVLTAGIDTDAKSSSGSVSILCRAGWRDGRRTPLCETGCPVRWTPLVPTPRVAGVTTDAYIHGHHESVLRSHRWRTAENSAGFLLPVLEPGMSLLDVGCGPGTVTIDLASRVARAVGIDRAPSVLAAAREAAAGTANVEFLEGDAYALPFADGSFDVVYAHQVLQHLKDPVAALREMRRVAKPGGYVAVRDADYAAMTWFPRIAGLDDWIALYHEVADANSNDADAGRKLLSWVLGAGYDPAGVVPGA